MGDPIVDAASALSAAIDAELTAASVLAGLSLQTQTANADVIAKNQAIDKASKVLSDAIAAKKAAKPITPTPGPVPAPVPVQAAASAEAAPVKHAKE
jgi:hypothetical protein